MRPVEYVVDICRALVSYYIHFDIGVIPVPTLHFAVKANSLPLVDALLSARLKFPDTVSQALSAIDRVTGNAPLHTAICSGNADVVKALLSAGAGIEVLDRMDDMPLSRAVCAGHTDIVKLPMSTVCCLTATHHCIMLLCCTTWKYCSCCWTVVFALMLRMNGDKHHYYWLRMEDTTI